MASLKIGTHDYFGKQIEVLPILTTMSGLCYKLEFSNPLRYQTLQYLMLVMTSSYQLQNIDKLKKTNIWIAANSTWQGIIHKNWPYSKKPRVISKKYKQNTHTVVFINLEENIWKYQTSVSDFNSCMNEFGDEDCKSIFNPKSYKCNNW